MSGGATGGGATGPGAMGGTACPDRGADLFVLARGGDPGDPGLPDHVVSCPSCGEELRALRALARRLPLATGALAPLPATREAVDRVVRRSAADLSPPRAGRRGRLLLLALPAGLLAASVAAVLLTAGRGAGTGERGAVAIRTLHGAALAGPLADGRLSRGETVTAAAVLPLHFGPPLDVEAVFGRGTVFRLPDGEAGGRSLAIRSGPAYLEVAGAPGGTGPLLRILAGGTGGDGAADAGEPVAVEARSARFAVEARANGSVVVYAASGVVTVRAAGRTVEARGPARVDVPPGAAPGEPLPAEPTDATGWFAYPEVRTSLEPNPAGMGRDLVVTLTPSLPRTIPVAPFSRFDPHFTLRAMREGVGLKEIPVDARMLRRPPPDAGPPGESPPGAFLLAPDRPYAIRIDPAELGLEPGTWSVGVVYNASLPGGLWRGSRASNTVDLEVEPR